MLFGWHLNSSMCSDSFAIAIPRGFAFPLCPPVSWGIGPYHALSGRTVSTSLEVYSTQFVSRRFSMVSEH